MNTQDVIQLASHYLNDLSGHTFDVLDVSKPVTANAAVNLAKVISKLSPLIGNLIEFNTVEFLNKQDEKRVYNTEVSGLTVIQWNKLLASNKEEKIKEILRDYLGIKTENIDKLLG